MLHIIGDIFDRGPHADLVMDELMGFHDVDIEWGNHDVSWMGAATGNLALVANVVRLGISYNNFDLLEDGYGINLRALSMFAAEVYQDDPCTIFTPHILDENTYDPVDIPLAAKMHKAIAIIQFKLEGQLIARHPEYQMEDRVCWIKLISRMARSPSGNHLPVDRPSLPHGFARASFRAYARRGRTDPHPGPLVLTQREIAQAYPVPLFAWQHVQMCELQSAVSRLHFDDGRWGI